MSDDLIERLRHGCVYRPRRWSGDTHTDLGGTINEDATDAVMADAADEIERLRAFIRNLEITVMHPHMGGDHQCRIRANGKNLTPEHWAIVMRCNEDGA